MLNAALSGPEVNINVLSTPTVDDVLRGEPSLQVLQALLEAPEHVAVDQSIEQTLQRVHQRLQQKEEVFTMSTHTHTSIVQQM